MTEWVVCADCAGRGHHGFDRCDECDNGRVLLTPLVAAPVAVVVSGENKHSDRDSDGTCTCDAIDGDHDRPGCGIYE